MARVGKLKIDKRYYENFDADQSDSSAIENIRNIKISSKHKGEYGVFDLLMRDVEEVI